MFNCKNDDILVVPKFVFIAMFVWSIVHIFRILCLNFLNIFFWIWWHFRDVFPRFVFGGLITAIIKDIFDDQALTTGAFSNDNEEFVQDIENFEL